MKNGVLILLLSFGAIFSMQQQPRSLQRGQKRPADQSNAPASKSAVITSRTAFELLPDEIKNLILSFLTTAKGATKRARLDNAAENIRSFFRINNQFAPLGNDPQIIEYLITQLANRYANGDKVAAALALGTEAAGRWLKSKLLPIRMSESKRFIRTEAMVYEAQVNEHFIDAASNGRLNVIKFLREFVPFYKDLDWNVALSIAVSRDQKAVVRYILTESLIQDKIDGLINDSDEGISLLALGAIENNQEQIVDMLLKAGANIDTSGTDLNSPLESAIYQKNPSMVRLILKQVPELLNELIQLTNSLARVTPLILAIHMDHLEIIKILLEAGADVNFRAANGTALEQAQELSFKKNNAEIIKLLKEYGAK